MTNHANASKSKSPSSTTVPDPGSGSNSNSNSESETPNEIANSTTSDGDGGKRARPRSNTLGITAEEAQALKQQLPVVVWSVVGGIAMMWYLNLLPLAWSLLMASAELVLFVASTGGGYYAWTLVQNLFVERELLVSEVRTYGWLVG